MMCSKVRICNHEELIKLRRSIDKGNRSIWMPFLLFVTLACIESSVFAESIKKRDFAAPPLGHNPNVSELHHCRNGLSETGHLLVTYWPLIGHLPVTCRLRPLTTSLCKKLHTESIIFCRPPPLTVGLRGQQVAGKWPISDRLPTTHSDNLRQCPCSPCLSSVRDGDVH